MIRVALADVRKPVAVPATAQSVLPWRDAGTIDAVASNGKALWAEVLDHAGCGARVSAILPIAARLAPSTPPVTAEYESLGYLLTHGVVVGVFLMKSASRIGKELVLSGLAYRTGKELCAWCFGVLEMMTRLAVSRV